jgi:hypothetical protein
MNIISKLVKNDLTKDLPYIAFKKEKLNDTCQKNKQVKTSFKSKNTYQSKNL